jgi:hypothetical protein
MIDGEGDEGDTFSIEEPMETQRDDRETGRETERERQTDGQLSVST